MGRVELYPHGTFCWVDLGARDLDAAKAFYGELLGWRIEQVDSADPGIYLVGRVDGLDAAGLHDHSRGDAHGWDSSIAVDDLDAALARVGELGGEVTHEAHDIPGSGVEAIITDGGGARVALWQAAGYLGARIVNETGTWSWNDLATRDPASAEAFYDGLFGWSVRQLAPGYWSISKGDLLIGGMRTMDEDPPETPPNWMPYFVVADADEASRRLVDLGGTVIVPPREVPAGRFLVAADPEGASIGLLEMGPQGPARGVDAVGG